MEEYVSSSYNKNISSTNSDEKKKLLLSDEALSNYIPSLDDELYNGNNIFWPIEDTGDELFRTKCEGYFSNLDTSSATGSSELIDYYTPHGIKRSIKDEEYRKRPKWDHCNESCTHRERLTPLPLILWADSKSIWDIMMHKADFAARNRNCRLFESTETILPRMRAILVEWIMEVCEVYRLRRSTYYLAVDYIDRYLSVNPSVPKNQLQLLGISALYIAAKFDEIYSPKVSEFAYVCDGACSETDILLCERLLLNALSWDINPMTPTTWLNLYMQIHFDNNNILNRNFVIEYAVSEYFLYPQYSAFDFVKASHLMDLLSLDPCFLMFSYNTIAASAMYYLYGRGCALRVSGLQWKDIEICVEYMSVFYAIIRNADDPKFDYIPTHVPIDRRDRATFNFLRHRVPDVTYGESHAMQTRCVTLDYLEKASILRLQRMGFRITKKCIKDKVKAASSKSNNENSVTEEKASEKQEPFVTFEIERECTSFISCYDDCLSVLNSNSESDMNEFFDCKSQFTFDEILEGINDCTIKKVEVLNKFCDQTDRSTNKITD